jgi:hypothetical protein
MTSVQTPTSPPAGAVERAVELRTVVAERVNEVVGEAAGLGDVYVGWVAALDVATCPARYRAGGADGWGFPGWSATLAGGAVARAALAEHLRVTAPAPAPDGGSNCSPPPLPQPVEAVRSWLRLAARAPTSPVAEWISELHKAGDRATIAATAAIASRWLAGFVRVAGWPLPDRLRLVVHDPDGPHTCRWHRTWRPPRQPPDPTRARARVTVASSPDAIVGKVTPAGEFDLLVHRPFSPNEEALADRAAFEAVAGALASGIVPRHVVATTADTGEQARCPVDDELLARGTSLVVEVVRQRAVAAGDGWGFDDATASAACRHCPERHDCPPGQQWLDGPGRWRGGLPALGSPTQ